MLNSEVTRDAVVAAARALKGTPYGKQGRRPHVRLDCVGLLIVVANQVGLEDNFDFTNYEDFPFKDDVRRWLETKTLAVPHGLAAAKPADIALVYDEHWASHTGWLCRDDASGRWAIIHATAKQRMVTEHPLDAEWERKIAGVFRHPRLID